MQTEDNHNDGAVGGSSNNTHTKCVGSPDKVIGLMISHMGSVYGMLGKYNKLPTLMMIYFYLHLVSNEILPGISNPLRFQGSQFSYMSAAKRAEMAMKYNAENPDDIISTIPATLELR